MTTKTTIQGNETRQDVRDLGRKPVARGCLQVRTGVKAGLESRAILAERIAL